MAPSFHLLAWNRLERFLFVFLLGQPHGKDHWSLQESLGFSQMQPGDCMGSGRNQEFIVLIESGWPVHIL